MYEITNIGLKTGGIGVAMSFDVDKGEWVASLTGANKKTIEEIDTAVQVAEYGKSLARHEYKSDIEALLKMNAKKKLSEGESVMVATLAIKYGVAL